MSKPKKIRLPAGLGMIAGTILQPDCPTSSEVKEQIYGAVLDTGDDSQPNVDVVKALVAVYSALLEAEDEDEIGFDIISGNDAEQFYRKYVVKAWRKEVSRSYPEATKSRDDEDVYEGCDWYEFGKMTWPRQLLAEIGYLVGLKNGREAVAMSRYYEARKAEEAAAL
jgi:hypothetical protein